MLHIRVVGPSDLTERLVDRLMADPGVVNLVVLRAAAARPDGNAVQFDVLTGSASSSCWSSPGSSAHAASSPTRRS